MWRKVLLLVGVLILALATISPAFADPKPRDGKPGKGPPAAGTPSASATPAAGAAAAATPGAMRGRSFQGTIKSISSPNWVVTTSQGDLTVNVGSLTGTSINWPGRKVVALGSFMVGDRVVIQLTGKPGPKDSVGTARKVHLIPGTTFVHFTGQVTGVDEGNKKVTVKNGAGTSTTFTLTDDTTVRGEGKPTTVSSLSVHSLAGTLSADFLNKADRSVTVVARKDANNTATAIVLHGNQADNDEQENEQDNDNKSEKG